MASVAYGKFYRWQTYDKCNNGTSIMTNETEPIVQLLHGLPGGHYHEPFHRLGFFLICTANPRNHNQSNQSI